MISVCVFFFFKHKTAYEMRISDWSSDVCSSDLSLVAELARQIAGPRHLHLDHLGAELAEDRRREGGCDVGGDVEDAHALQRPDLAIRLHGIGHGVLSGREDRKSTRLNSSH